MLLVCSLASAGSAVAIAAARCSYLMPSRPAALPQEACATVLVTSAAVITGVARVVVPLLS